MRPLQKISTDNLLAELGARLQPMEPAGDWVDAFDGGEVLRTDQAAFIAGTSDETVRRRCVEAADTGRRIGILFARAVWLVSKRRLLDDIERRDGRSARLAAETRAEKLFKTRPPPQLSLRSVATPTVIEADRA
jgi:hypothetical protein